LVTAIELFESPEITPLSVCLSGWMKSEVKKKKKKKKRGKHQTKTPPPIAMLGPGKEKLKKKKKKRKGGYTRRIALSHFGCCCPHKET